MTNIRQAIIDALISDEFLGDFSAVELNKLKVGNYTSVCDSTESSLPIRDRKKLCIAKLVLSPLQSQSLKDESDFPTIFVSIDHAPRSNADAELGFTQEAMNILLEVALHDEVGPPDYDKTGLGDDASPTDAELIDAGIQTLPLTSQVVLFMNEFDRIFLPSAIGTIHHCIDDSKSGIVAFLTGPLVESPRQRAQPGEKLTCHLRIVFTLSVLE